MRPVDPDLIREFRTKEGLSRADLASRLGVDQSTIARWENGESKPTGTAGLIITALVGSATSGFLYPAILGLHSLLGTALARKREQSEKCPPEDEGEAKAK